MKLSHFLIIYFVAVSLFASIVTVTDKRKAIKGKYRISEATLFVLGFLGGALSEYITMRLIHHKTLHKRFMLGLPAIVLLHILILIFVLYYAI